MPILLHPYRALCTVTAAMALLLGLAAVPAVADARPLGGTTLSVADTEKSVRKIMAVGTRLIVPGKGGDAANSLLRRSLPLKADATMKGHCGDRNYTFPGPSYNSKPKGVFRLRVWDVRYGADQQTPVCLELTVNKPGTGRLSVVDDLGYYSEVRKLPKRGRIAFFAFFADQGDGWWCLNLWALHRVKGPDGKLDVETICIVPESGKEVEV